MNIIIFQGTKDSHWHQVSDEIFDKIQNFFPTIANPRYNPKSKTATDKEIFDEVKYLTYVYDLLKDSNPSGVTLIKGVLWNSMKMMVGGMKKVKGKRGFC